jgi:inner membrane protein
LFWPIYSTPMTWSTIFIIDPLYTLPLLVGVICALVAGRKAVWGQRMNAAGLALSSLYLVWTVGAKLHVEDVARESLARQGISSERLQSVAAPFNTLLWRVLVVADDGYYEGFYSLLDRERTLNVTRYPSEPALLSGLEQYWPVQRLQWFTKGFYAVSRRDDAVVMTDLRMGLEPEYVFNFKVGEVSNPHSRPAPPEMLPAIRNFGRLAWVWERIWSADAIEKR